MASSDLEKGLEPNSVSLEPSRDDSRISPEITPIKTQPALSQELTAQFILSDKEALTPDPGTEHLFEMENNKFAFTPRQLSKLLDPKSLSAFYALGGVVGLEKGLRSNVTSGLSAEEVSLDGAVSFEEATAVVSSKDGIAANVAGISKTTSDALMITHSKSDGLFSDRKRVFAETGSRIRRARACYNWHGSPTMTRS
jgi:Ca2+-transporting ATPase